MYLRNTSVMAGSGGEVYNALGNIKQLFLRGSKIGMVRQQMQEPDKYHLHVLDPFRCEVTSASFGIVSQSHKPHLGVISAWRH